MIEVWALRALLVAGLVGGAWWWADSRGYERAERKHAAALVKAKDEARQMEQNWQTNVDALNEVTANEKRRISAEHARALDGLRRRASSRLPETPASCSGASPASLAAPDAAVAIGFATEFDNLRAEYSRCKSAYDALTATATERAQ